MASSGAFFFLEILSPRVVVAVQSFFSSMFAPWWSLRCFLPCSFAACSSVVFFHRLICLAWTVLVDLPRIRWE